jgi:hypothetical protein
MARLRCADGSGLCGGPCPAGQTCAAIGLDDLRLHQRALQHDVGVELRRKLPARHRHLLPHGGEQPPELCLRDALRPPERLLVSERSRVPAGPHVQPGHRAGMCLQLKPALPRAVSRRTRRSVTRRR